MPVDKLILLSQHVRWKFKKLALRNHPQGGYKGFIDLSKTQYKLPIKLYCDGRFNHINKIEVLQVAKLGFTRVLEIVRRVCGNLRSVRICRIDFAVDLPNVPASELAAHCRVADVQSSPVFRSRGGVSYYPHRSHDKTVLIYERKKRLVAKRDPLANLFRSDAHVTRLEIQFCTSKSVPIRHFTKALDYLDVDVLAGVTFLAFKPIRLGLKLQQRLAAERIQFLVQELGLQSASKLMTGAEWGYVRKTWFEPSPAKIQDVRAAMRRSVRDWFKDRIRFPRFSLNSISTTGKK